MVVLAWWFHLFINVVNCASNPPMQGNGEIAHAGILAVAQLVIVVHLTAAFQPYNRGLYVQCIIPSVTLRM